MLVASREGIDDLTEFLGSLRPRRGRLGQGRGSLANDVADRVDVFGGGRDAHRLIEVAESRHRGGHGRRAHRQALMGLDRVERLGERAHDVGHDEHVSVLEVAGNLGIRSRSEPQHPGRVQTASRGFIERIRSDEDDRRLGQCFGQPGGQVDIEAIGVQRAHVHRARARR